MNTTMTSHSRCSPLRFPRYAFCAAALAAAFLTLCSPRVQADTSRAPALQPNLEINSERRCYTPGEGVRLDIAAFNVSAVQLAAYPIDLGKLVHSSAAMTDFDKTIAAMPLPAGHPAAAWRTAIKAPPPDQWTGSAITAPRLAPGAYLIVATAARTGDKTVQKRTWIAVTSVAVIAKRSTRELLLYTADANSGRPIPNVSLQLYDKSGPFHAAAATGLDGTVRDSIAGAHGSLWAYGATLCGPAFAADYAPDPPDRYAVYSVTDRPVYRPGNLVQYKATIRSRIDDSSAPGGYRWKPYAQDAATLEVRDPSGALVDKRAITTDANGALSGSLQLAAEPSLGDWQMAVKLGKDYESDASFSVQAYRKPEMTVAVKFDHQHYLGGSPVPVTIDAQYFFGRPVANSPVRYHVAIAGDYDYGTPVESSYDGSGFTDATGHFALSVPTRRVPVDCTVSVQATVTDLSRRRAQGEDSTTVTAGLYQLSLDTDKTAYRPSEPITVTAHAVDYDNHNVAGAKVRIDMIEHKQDNRHRPYDETTSRDVVTGKNGEASTVFSTPRQTELEFRAVSFDAQQDKIAAEADASVTTDRSQLADQDEYPPLDVSSPKTDYQAGQQATITIKTRLTRVHAVPAAAGTPRQTARTEAWALITLEGAQLGQSRVVHLTKPETIVPIPLTAQDFPGTTVTVAIIQDKQMYTQPEDVTVGVPGKKLAVTITPNQAKYQPGQTADYTVITRDDHGLPVPADVSLGVVDKSIYDIAPDNAQNMSSVFYSDDESRVTSSYSFEAQPPSTTEFNVSRVSIKTLPAIAEMVPPAAPPPAPKAEADLEAYSTGPPGGGIRVRSAFADTAFWDSGVETGPDGTAQVTFQVPDDLTTWRATARAITLDTRLGSKTQDAVSAMPLLVRLEMPRFTVQGDQSVISAVVQNGTPQERTVRVTLQPQGASLNTAAAPLEQTLDLPPSGSQRCDWPMSILAGAKSASFQVTADGGPGGQDAAAASLPVLPDGVQTVTASAAVLTASDPRYTIDLTRLPAGASLALTLSPSLASGMLDAVHYLADQPDGSESAEEIASVMVADTAATRALQDVGKSTRLKTGVDVKAFTANALQTLYRYQHPDGGWNWWEFDQTDGDMTATVLSALVQARDAGFAVDPDRLHRGAARLFALLKDQQDLDARADWLLALSAAYPNSARARLFALYAQRSKLGTYSQASLALALSNVASKSIPGDAAAQDAQTVARELSASATIEGRSASWPLQPGDTGCFWAGDDVLLTAHALRALLAVTPSDPKIPAAVRWLMANREGASWDTTRTTSEAILALSQYIEQTGELAADFTTEVSLDGQRFAAQSVATEQPASAHPVPPLAPMLLTVTPDQLAGHKTLTIDRRTSGDNGAGVLYVSEVTTSLTPPIAAVPQAHGLTVKREFRLAVEDPSQSLSVPSGSGLDVVLDIDADTDYRYVRVEDRIPAGCEVTNGDADDNNPGGASGYPIDYSDGSVGYTRQETRDDRVEFYFDSLPKGHTQLTYHLSGETPGTYRILGADAALAYQPEVRGSTGLAQVTIGD